ncbi:methyl-accepting chemotaxis protein [Halonatronum saccharophilum]|uniref:methyl-accepting chemotaxis protein n=1 Tax=Halonatronum saccharophilum TaxID=150060 RepID=UPI0004814CC4|nr:methyl-accepting chemotaxis protein [Halonatronum saccharophilum]
MIKLKVLVKKFKSAVAKIFNKDSFKKLKNLLSKGCNIVKDFLVDKFELAKEFYLKQGKGNGQGEKDPFKLTIVKFVQMGFILMMLVIIFVGFFVYRGTAGINREIEEIRYGVEELTDQSIPIIRRNTDLVNEINRRQIALYRWEAGLGNTSSLESEVAQNNIANIKTLTDNKDILASLEDVTRWNDRFEDGVESIRGTSDTHLRSDIMHNLHDRINLQLGMASASLTREIWDNLHSRIDELSLRVENISEDSRSSRNIVIIVAIVTLLIGILLGFFISLSIYKVTKEVKDQTYKASDKAEIVSKSAYSMKEVAEEVTIKLNKSVEIIMDMMSGNNEISEAISQVSLSIKEVSTGAESLALNAEEVSKAGNETYSVIKDTYKKIEYGDKLIEDTAIIMNKLQASVEKIGNISDRIMKIGDQTNLLALNAAIEAARAGESGKGFAVVAQEIKKLADESMVATKEVKNIVQEVEAVSAKAIRMMIMDEEEGREDSIVRVFSDIKDSSAKVRDKMEQVISFADDQVAATQEMSALSQEISATSEEVAAQTGESTSSADSLNDIMVEVTDFNDKLYDKVNEQLMESKEQLELIDKVVESNKKLSN